MRAVLLRPLPFQNPGRLAQVLARNAKTGADFPWVDGRDVGLRVTANLFPLLGVQPALGRNILPTEDRPGAGRVVLIGDSLWRRRFASDPRLKPGVPLTQAQADLSAAAARIEREQRRIRMTLGASPGDVRRLVLGEGLALAAAGVAIGLAGALALTRLAASLLFGVSATDALVFTAVPLFLLAV